MYSIANFTNSAGLATNPIGPEAVVSLSYGCDSTAFDGSNGAPIFNTPAPPFPPAGANIFFRPRNLVTTYVQNWNLNMEQELAGSAAFQLGYVGSKATMLVRLRDANPPDVNGDRPNANFGSWTNLPPSTRPRTTCCRRLCVPVTGTGGRLAAGFQQPVRRAWTPAGLIPQTPDQAQTNPGVRRPRPTGNSTGFKVCVLGFLNRSNDRENPRPLSGRGVSYIAA